MTRRFHANDFGTTLASGITNVATSMTLSSVSGLPAIGTGEVIYFTIEEGSNVEVVIGTDDSSSPTYTITRGAEGTSGVAFTSAATVSVYVTKDSIDRKADLIATAGDVINFGDADSLEIPNNATATLSAAGQVAIDTAVTDYADGVMVYRAGSTDYGVVAIPKSALASPTNNYVVTYDSATDKFKLASAGGGITDGDYGDVTVSGTGTVITIDTPSSVTHAANDKLLFKDTSASDAMAYTTFSNITTVGTLINGTWNASTHTVPYGGTGMTTCSNGDVIVGVGADTMGRLAKNTNASRYLSNTGSSFTPAWAQIDLTNGVTGTLPTGNGGTGVTTSTGSGNNVLSTSPTLVTPILGKPTSGDLENCSTGSAWPFRNLLAYNGRFWTTANNFTVTISGGSFNQEGIFVAYNGSTFADGGRFYTDNSTNGGAGSAINTNVQDLLTAMGRTGTYARYGVEFNLCSIVAGAGTAGSQTFTGATRYLLTAASAATNGANSQVTFIGWVRAIGGTLGIRCSSTVNQQLYINGTLQSQTNYDLTTATGWVHVRVTDQNLFGYSAAFPGLYSQSGSSCLVACAAIFNGAVNAGLHLSPIIGQGSI